MELAKHPLVLITSQKTAENAVNPYFTVWHVTSEVHNSRYVRTQSSKKQRGAHSKERKKTLPDAKQIQVFPISLKRWHLPEILLLYKPFQTLSAAVWWKAIYWMRGSDCWSHNGPCCWPQPSICVCKSHKHKTERKKHPIRSQLSDLKHEEDKSKYLSCDSSWLLPSTTALIGEYLQCTRN